MNLELKEINYVGNLNTTLNNNFNNFEDILLCFKRQKNSFEKIEKDLFISSFGQIMFIFIFFLFIHPLLTIPSLLIKFGFAYFFQKMIKIHKLEFPFSSFISSVLSFSNTKFKKKNHKIYLYQCEKRKFLEDFFTFPIHKTIILDYLHSFYANNEARLSTEVYAEIDNIKIAIEKENYEIAFNAMLKFQQRINYIKQLETYSF